MILYKTGRDRSGFRVKKRTYHVLKKHSVFRYTMVTPSGRDILAFSPAVGYTDGVSGRSYIIIQVFYFMNREMNQSAVSTWLR